ncbi:hypothetical protein CHS0354_011423 [Potamilus streckersoni]|uniref:Uncharacterized protein n=1 Tax=Potamilus streckersoni TaxID=2493646 RepID=A0AAE0TGD1_9BIVA|nr:hypothetical protein CHS0354_011423 [Potamilus streckersoni]
MKLIDIAIKTGGRYLTYLETPSITFLDEFAQTVLSGTLVPNAGNPLVVSPFRVVVIGEDGEYVFTINQSPETSTNIFVSSFPKPNVTNAVRVSTWFSGTAIDFAAREDITLFASVDQCRSPVLNVKVRAVLKSGKDETKIVLNDNGTGPDLLRNDGIYSAYILKKYFTINGRHNMKVFVEGVLDIDYNLPEFAHSARRRSPLSQNTGSSFTRVSIPNEIVVTNFTTHSGDTTPPDRIRDFRVTQILGENKYILEWTATGDDRDQAQMYDMRSSDDIDVIRYNFSAAVPVENATFSPHHSGEMEEIALYGIVDDRNQSETSYLAIRAIDDSGNIGDVSNIISVVRSRSFWKTDRNNLNLSSTITGSNSNEQTTIIHSKTKHDEDSDHSKAKESVPLNNLAIVLPSVSAGICILLAIIVSLLLLKVFKKKQRLGHDNSLGFNNIVWPTKDRFQPISITHEQRPASRAWDAKSSPPPYIH